MAVQVPTPDQLRAVAAEMGLSLTGADVESFINLMRPSVAAYNVVDSIPDNLPAVKYPRTPGYRPQGDENRHNAWYVKTVVEGAPKGKLKGKTVVLKDNIMLAGVPMITVPQRSKATFPMSMPPWCNASSMPAGLSWVRLIAMPVGRQSHLCRSSAQSAQDGLLGDDDAAWTAKTPGWIPLIGI
jgi:hypothetical protein